MYSNLIEAKSILVQYIDKTDFDLDAIEYLIDTIDYLLTGSIPCSEEILSIFLNDIVVTSSYHKTKDLLKVAALVENTIKEMKCTK